MSNLAELLEELALLRNHLDAEKAKLKPLEDAIDNLNKTVLAAMNDAGITTARTHDGHAITVVKNSSARVVDAEAFFDFVFDSGDVDFLQKRVTTEAVTKFLAETNELPPGVELVQVNTLRFSRAKQ